VPVIKYKHQNKKALSEALEYALRCQEDGAPVWGENVTPEALGATQEFRSIHKAHGRNFSG